MMKDDVPPDPVDIRLFSAAAVVTRANRVAHAVEQFGWVAHTRASGEYRADAVSLETRASTVVTWEFFSGCCSSVSLVVPRIFPWRLAPFVFDVRSYGCDPERAAGFR